MPRLSINEVWGMLQVSKLKDILIAWYFILKVFFTREYILLHLPLYLQLLAKWHENQFIGLFSSNSLFHILTFDRNFVKPVFLHSGDSKTRICTQNVKPLFTFTVVSPNLKFECHYIYIGTRFVFYESKLNLYKVKKGKTIPHTNTSVCICEL